MAVVYSITEKIAQLGIIITRMNALRSHLQEIKKERDNLVAQDIAPDAIHTTINARLAVAEAEADQIGTDLGTIEFTVDQLQVRSGYPSNPILLSKLGGLIGASVYYGGATPLAAFEVGDIIWLTGSEDAADNNLPYEVTDVDVSGIAITVTPATLTSNAADQGLTLTLKER